MTVVRHGIFRFGRFRGRIVLFVLFGFDIFHRIEKPAYPFDRSVAEISQIGDGQESDGQECADRANALYQPLTDELSVLAARIDKIPVAQILKSILQEE